MASTHPSISHSGQAPLWKPIALALLCLVLARGALVLSQADVFGYEEFAKAELGHAMLADLGVEHFRLAYHYYEVGGFVFSHLLALSFALFGDSLISIKLVALGWHALVLALAMTLAHAAYGRKAMAVAAIAFVLPPAGLQKLSLLALGIHFDSLVFHAWILLHAGRIAVEGSRSARDVFGLGLACGLGATFNLTTLAASACAGLALLASAARELGLGGWSRLAGGALLGLAPWLWMASQTGSAILDLHGETLGSGSGSGQTLARLTAFWGVLWNERSLLDRADLLARAGLFLWGAATLLCARDRRLGWTRLLLAHLGMFVAASLASGLVVGRIAHYNEFARPSPTWLAIALVSGGALARELEAPARARRWIARCAIALLALFGLRSLAQSLGEVPPSRWGESAATLAATSGCGYTECVTYLFDHLDGPTEDRVAVLRRLEVPSRERLESAIAWAAYGRRPLALEEAVELARQVGGDEYWRAHVLGLAAMVMRDADWDMERVPDALARFEGELRDLWLETAARNMPQRQQLRVLEQDIELGLRRQLPESWFVGLGWRLAQLHLVSARVPYQDIRPIHPGYDPVAAREFIASQPEAVRAPLERGWLAGRAELRARP